MNDRFGEFYPAEAYVTPVITLPVPRMPAAPAPRPNKGSVEAFYGTALLSRVMVGCGCELALIDKAFPHSRYDVMLLASDDVPRSSVADLCPSLQELIFKIAHQFVCFVSDGSVIEKFELEDGIFHVSFNFSKMTTDRESSMFFEKRFHLHLNYTPGSDLRFGPAVPWGEVKKLSLRRRLLDPLVFLGEAVLTDALRGSAWERYLLPIDRERDLAMGLPSGLKAEFGTWAFLIEPRFRHLLTELHVTAQRAYCSLRAAVVSEKSSEAGEEWSRPPLRSADDVADRLSRLDWLSADTRQQIACFAAQLRNVPPSLYSRFKRSEHDRVRCLSLNGLDYSVGMFARGRNGGASPLAAAEKVYLNLQTRMFGDIGGAGLPPLYPHPMVRLDRASGSTMSAAELMQRRQFRDVFLETAALELPELAKFPS